MKRLLWAAVTVAMLGIPVTGGAETPEETRLAPPSTARNLPTLAMLRTKLDAEASSGKARVGLAAIDISTGDMVSVNGDQHFPMASTVKVAIAAAFLHGVQQGRLSLDAMYRLPPAQRQAARGLGDMRLHGRPLSGAELMDLMLIRSDNAAADTLLYAIGGTRALGTWLDNAGIAGQRVDRSIAELLRDHETKKRIRVGKGKRRRWITVSVPRAAPVGDKRDSSTPEAMVALLAKLRNGELLDARRTTYLFDVMERCRTGPGRIRGLLPAGTRVAHKTGTMNGITDDVGIVTLPNGHDLAVAIFETGSGGSRAHDRKIAQLSRILYDHFSATS
ncbi:class A beta-lactamase [Sphingomonas sp. AP4-R1]|uniref:class A beta-lactamase n=1 Tax=Sphingomonas sp. AP4-R1 TaxID=2735134 RepID=UPI001493BD13|nr:class A beta-lactamase [Sphingomonas sp. AP4-R1]QJU56504.1 class A beta-lactamase [Sphingomonas sp. AP4-R1]